MPKLTDMTLEQMRVSTKAQIIDGVRAYLTANYLTRGALMGFLLDTNTLPDPPVAEFYADGQIKLITEVLRDAETGNRVSGRKTQWTYFPNGIRPPVRYIRIRNYDAAGNELFGQGLEIEHYLDCRPPTRRAI
jgi:hypothetical protein